MIEIELIVGTMGLDKILADKLPKYNPHLLTKAASTLRAFRKGAGEFADSAKPGSMPDEKYELKDYDDLVAMLQEEPEIMSVIEGLETWPSELQTEIMVKIADVKAYLQGQMPQQQMSGSIASFPLPPSDSDKFRFLWQANLCDDVRTFIDLLNAGAITPIESALMRTLFPETHDYLLVEVMDKVMDAAVAGDMQEWEGSWRKPALSGFLGVPVTNFQDVMQNQTGFQEKTAGRPKEPGSVQVASSNLTDNQKLDTKTLDLSK